MNIKNMLFAVLMMGAAFGSSVTVAAGWPQDMFEGADKAAAGLSGGFLGAGVGGTLGFKGAIFGATLGWLGGPAGAVVGGAAGLAIGAAGGFVTYVMLKALYNETKTRR